MLGPVELRTAVSRQLGRPVEPPGTWVAEEVRGGTGKATGGVWRVSGNAIPDGTAETLAWALIAKSLRAPSPTDRDAHVPQHWSYWRREGLAYESTLLPGGGGGLDSPACFGVFPDADETDGLVVALATIDAAPVSTREQFGVAAHALGQWQAGWLDHGPPVAWLAVDQLRQRIARTDAGGGLHEPDWSIEPVATAFPTEVRGGLRAGWDMRWSLLRRSASCPVTLTHGDFSRANLFATADDRILVIDWACLGLSPAGFDLAHLVLSALAHCGDASSHDVEAGLLGAYLGAFPDDVRTEITRSYTIAAALTATSRLWWSLRRSDDATVIESWASRVPWILAAFDRACS